MSIRKIKKTEPAKNDLGVQAYGFFSRGASQLFLAAIIFLVIYTPHVASASILDDFSNIAQADTATNTSVSSQQNSQDMPLAEANMGPNVSDNADSSLDTVDISDTTLTPQVGPMGSNLDVSQIIENSDQISIYTVHSGDTLSSIADMFDVSEKTILDANDIPKNQPLKVGTVLAIPPISEEESDDSSGVSSSSTTLEQSPKQSTALTTQPAKKASKKTPANSNANKGTTTTDSKPASNDTSSEDDVITAHPMKVDIKTDLGKALLRPVALNVSVETQGAHDIFGSAVDLGAPAGTPIHASYDGTVVLALSTGWNGGYGEYVIVMSNIDGNIVQYIDAHMSKVLTKVGDHVTRGQVIGLVGRTGNATGNHVHFQVLGALNPLTIDPNYTGE